MGRAEEIIEQLGLRLHPGEGGFYDETYRSKETIPATALPDDYDSERSVSTAIYYLLKQGTFSSMHQLPGDEVFHFYTGDPVEMLQLHPSGRGEIVVLGTDLSAGMRPQVVVPGGVWQGSRLVQGGEYALLGTTMAPGFAFADFQIGARADLVKRYPAFEAHIIELTRE